MRRHDEWTVCGQTAKQAIGDIDPRVHVRELNDQTEGARHVTPTLTLVRRNIILHAAATEALYEQDDWVESSEICMACNLG